MIKPGDLVKLCGSLWSSYPREGEVGIILEMTGSSPVGTLGEYTRVLWNKDGQSGICKASDLRIINEIS